MRYLLPFLLLIAATASATVDPLANTYKPSVDTNCADAQYSATSWMTDGGTKLRQDSGTNPGNSCYLSGSTQLYGTQNEFVDFQVHYRDSGSGTPNLNVIVGNFVQSSPNSATITSSSPGIIVYREWYTNVNIKTGTSTSYYNSTGHYPDVLIPGVDPYWGQTTNAWPFTVAAGNNQSAWVDVLIPPGTPAGYYLGSVTVKSGSTTIATMPVVIAVWQWPSAGYMPSSSTLKIVAQDGTSYNEGCVQMYNPATSTVSCTTYPGAGGDSDTGNTWIFIDTSQLLLDHRYGDGSEQNMFPEAGSFATWVTNIGPLLSGTGSVLHGGSGTTQSILSGAKLSLQQMSVLTPGASVWSNWQTNFDSNSWGTAGNPPLFNYLYDEPHTQGNFTTVYNNGSTRHGYLSAPSVPNLVTTDIYLSQGSKAAANTMSTTICGSNSCVLNVIDYLVAPINILEPIGGPLQTLSDYTTWQGGSTLSIPRMWMSYQACSNSGTCTDGVTGGSTFTYPNYNIDGTPIANRVFEWMTYFHGQTGELYYATSVCAQSGFYSQCHNGGSYGPWSGTYYSGGWGDGTLLYFGSVGAGNASAENYVGAGVTTPIILPSIRLKLMRDGVQDYEYMYKLNALGYSSTVNAQVASEVTNSYTFGSWGTLQAARVVLGNLMHSLSYPASGVVAPPRSGLLLAKQ